MGERNVYDLIERLTEHVAKLVEVVESINSRVARLELLTGNAYRPLDAKKPPPKSTHTEA